MLALQAKGIIDVRSYDVYFFIHADPILGDYVQGSNLITFGPASTDLMECVNLTISDNDDFEPAEMFSIQLTAAQAPLTIDPTRSVATVTIPEDS